VRGFYKAGTKMTPRFRVGIGVSGSRNGTLDPESCDCDPGGGHGPRRDGAARWSGDASREFAGDEQGTSQDPAATTAARVGHWCHGETAAATTAAQVKVVSDEFHGGWVEVPSICCC